MPANQLETEQLSDLTANAATEFSNWLDSIMCTLSSYDISSGHPEPNAAMQMVDAFTQSISNAVSAWSDPQQSSDSIRAVLRHLELTAVQCSSAESAIVVSMLQAARPTLLGEQGANEHAEPHASKLHALIQVIFGLSKSYTTPYNASLNMLTQLACVHATCKMLSQLLCCMSLGVVSLQLQT